ncbi:MAG: phage scaffolding protein [Burkholderiales bacterium]
MEFLKDVLGEELYNQVAEKLKGNDKIKLANLAEGQYVDKKKFDEAETERKRLADELKKVDVAGLQATNEQLKKDVAALKLGAAIDAELYAAGAVNVTALKAVMDMSGIKEENGKYIGIKEAVAAAKTANPWGFPQTSVPGAGGNPVPPAAGTGTKGTFADAIKERMESTPAE